MNRRWRTLSPGTSSAQSDDGALRYNQAPRATLDVDDRHGAGASGEWRVAAA